MIRNSGRLSGACVCALLSILLTARLAGVAAPPLQTPAAPPARVDPLTIEFLAVSQSGTPFVDIKAEDVQIRIDGKQRQVRSLRMLQVGDPSIADASAPLPQPFGSNDSAEIGRNMLIVIEDESIFPGNERSGREALTRFVNALGSRDRVGILTVPHGGLAVGLTRDHGRVLQALTQFVGRGSRSEDAADAACRSRLTLQSLAAVLSRTRTDEGPLTLIFLSSSMIGGRGAEAPAADVPNAALTSRRCELTPDEYRKVAVETAGAHAFFYIIQPEVTGGNGTANEPTTIAGAIPRWDSNPRSGLEHLSGVTGGPLLYLTGGDGDTLSHVLRETSIYYVATVDPEPNERNGAPHQISVKTNRSGVSLRTRPDVIIPRAVNSGVVFKPGPATAYDLLLEGRVFRDLPLRGLGYSSRGASGDITVLAMLEPGDATPLASAAIGLYDAQGALVNQWTAKDTDLARRRMTVGLAVKPGTYRLRVAAMDGTGRAGTADYEVAAALTPVGPLKMGSLILGLSRNGTYEPRLQFGPEPVALAYLEIYGRPPGAGAQITLALELATSLNGPALVTVPGVVSATNEDDKFLVNAAIPIGTLAPGDYIVRAIIGLEGSPAERVYRTFRKQ